jgi:hypothetical protein
MAQMGRDIENERKKCDTLNFKIQTRDEELRKIKDS